MRLKISEAAELIGGKVFGDKNAEIVNVARIQEAAEGDLTFLYLSAYEKYIDSTLATAVLVSPDFPKTRQNIIYIEVENPNIAFQKIISKYFAYTPELSGIDETAFVHPDARLGKNVSLGKNSVISANCIIGNNVKIFHNTVLMENTSIGEDSLIYPNVTIRENCKVGNSVIIHSGTVIGSDGFGYTPNAGGEFEKIPQIGNVIIEDYVEIGSNVSIDRAAIGSTRIGRGSKIDNLVQIAHNATVGNNTAISAQSGVSGSTKIGNNCILAGQVGLVGHIEIADGVIIGAQSGVSKSITKPGKYFGYPAKELTSSLRLESHIRSLPKYAEKIKILEKKIEELEKSSKI